jgi:hypothetical protein
MAQTLGSLKGMRFGKGKPKENSVIIPPPEESQESGTTPLTDTLPAEDILTSLEAPWHPDTEIDIPSGESFNSNTDYLRAWQNSVTTPPTPTQSIPAPHLTQSTQIAPLSQPGTLQQYSKPTKVDRASAYKSLVALTQFLGDPAHTAELSQSPEGKEALQMLRNARDDRNLPLAQQIFDILSQ